MFDFTTRHSMSLVMAAVLLVITSNGCQSRQHLGAAKPDAQRISQFAPSAQGHATLVAASDDRMLLIWDSRRQQGGKYGIIGRFINADGTAATDEFTINTYVHDHQMHPAAAMAADSRTWVTWSSWMQDGDRGSIVARYFDGATWGHELGVNNTRVGHQTHPVVAISEDGTALVVWTSSTREQSTINARLMRPEGVIGDEFVLSSSDFNGSVPGVAPLADGWLVTWAEHDGEGMHGVHAAQLDAHGEMCNGPILVAADAIEPVVASNGTQAIIAWLQQDQDRWRLDAQMWGRDETPMQVVQAEVGKWITGAAVDIDAQGQTTFAWTYDKPIHETWVRTMDEGALQNPELLASDAHLEAARATNRVHRAENGTIHSALSGKAGGDKKAAIIASTGSAGTARWTDVDVSTSDLTYALPQTQPDLLPVFDPTTTPTARHRGVIGGSGFEGIDSTGWTPPDPEVAAGPNHLVEVTNGGIAFFTHDGMMTFQDAIEGSGGFWGPVGATSFVFDPEVLYDQRSQRFFAMANERSSGGGSYFLLAVSDDADPNGSWHKYRLDMSHIDDDIDSPNMAVDEDTVYLSCDMFGPDKYPILMIPKNQVLNGDPVADTTELLLSGSGEQSFGLTRSSDDEPNIPQFMLQSDEGSSGSTFNWVRIHAIRDPLGSPYRQTFDLTVPQYTYPSQVPQQGTSVQHYLFESRFWSCCYRNGSIWAVHHVNNQRARVRWYEIDLQGWPVSGNSPVLAQHGEIDQGAGIYTCFPSIGVDTNNNVAIVFARGSSDEYTSMWQATRRASDPLNTLQSPVLIRSSAAPETSGRWGDYSGVSDAPDGSGLWMTHQWRPNGGWSTWIEKVPMCPGDIDGNGAVGVNDVLLVLAGFGGTGPGDANGDGIVGVSDILLIIGSWGPC